MAANSQLWGDYEDDDGFGFPAVPASPAAATPVPNQTATTSAGVSASVAPWAVRGSVDADEFRQIAEQSREGFNLEFKQALSLGSPSTKGASSSMADALKKIMTASKVPPAPSKSRKTCSRAEDAVVEAASTGARKRTAHGQLTSDAERFELASSALTAAAACSSSPPAPAWATATPVGATSFAQMIRGSSTKPAAIAAAATPTTARNSKSKSTTRSSSSSHGTDSAGVEGADAPATPPTAVQAPAARCRPVSRAISFASVAGGSTAVDSQQKRFKPADTTAEDASSPQEAEEEAEVEDDDSSQEADERWIAPQERPSPEPLTEARVAKRQMQIDLGKGTAGYVRYGAAVPRDRRQDGNPLHPSTPDARAEVSKRAWAGRARQWRRQLHQWDEETPAGAIEAMKALGSARAGKPKLATKPRGRKAASRAVARKAALPSLAQAMSAPCSPSSSSSAAAAAAGST